MTIQSRAEQTGSGVRSTGSGDAAHTSTPWRVFTNDDGTKLVGIGSGEGQGILDCGFGVWAWDDAEGIANANLVVKAVNSHADLMKALDWAMARVIRKAPHFAHEGDGELYAFAHAHSLLAKLKDAGQ